MAVAASAACFTALEIRNGGLGANLYGILGAARTLLSGRPPTALNLISYPATTFPLYAPLALLPDRVAQPLTQVGSLALLAAVLFAWGRSDGERPTAWLAALLFSPPAIGLVWIDQVNTAVALASLSAAVFLVNGPRRSVAGALGAVTLVLRPFNAIPALPALGFLHRRSRRLAVAVLWCCIVTGAVALVAWRWDGSLIHDLLNTASRRPISGVAGFARQLLGLPGLLGYLAALLAFEIWLARALEPTHSRLDSAAILIAVSVLGVHLGGNYPAVYCFPALARLTARSPSPAWPVAFTVLYAA
ncbi:MAG TPA: glycosyltransferase 87 family protein, partial [Candidatus Binatia bacterium]|nr:glycosyltransferase 87 family protein [Candidatus Binatia bacterium]